ncbi:MAG: ribosome maturation factor RimP [Oscillospiraceae bacterium]
MAKKTNVASAVREAAQPIADRLGLTLWDVVYVKEGPSWFLRAIIDKPGGVSIDDCESVSRELDPAVDALEIAESDFYFEVSSPGLGRELLRNEHIASYVGKPVRVKRYTPDEHGEREFAGVLESFDGERLTFAEGHTVDKKDAAYIKADDDNDLKGTKK